MQKPFTRRVGTPLYSTLDYPGVYKLVLNEVNGLCHNPTKPRPDPKPRAKTRRTPAATGVPSGPRLYPADIERIDQLVQAGYGGAPSGPCREVIRRAIDETARWTVRK
jgi:hypothetical protein